MILELKQYMEPEAGDTFGLPVYRHPSRKNIANLFPAFGRRARLAKDSFVALGLFAEENRDRVFLCVILCYCQVVSGLQYDCL